MSCWGWQLGLSGMRDRFGIFGSVIRIRKLSLFLVMTLRMPNTVLETGGAGHSHWGIRRCWGRGGVWVCFRQFRPWLSSRCARSSSEAAWPRGRRFFQCYGPSFACYTRGERADQWRAAEEQARRDRDQATVNAAMQTKQDELQRQLLTFQEQQLAFQAQQTAMMAALMAASGI